MLLVLVSSVAMSLQDHDDFWVGCCHQSFPFLSEDIFVRHCACSEVLKLIVCYQGLFQVFCLLSIWYSEDMYDYSVSHLNAQPVWSA